MLEHILAQPHRCKSMRLWLQDHEDCRFLQKSGMSLMKNGLTR